VDYDSFIAFIWLKNTMMKSSKTRIWIAKSTMLVVWALMAYQVPALVAYQSRLVEIVHPDSVWSFAILLGYLSILLIFFLIGLWLIRASRADGFEERFDPYLSENLYNALLGLLLVWLIWIIINQNLVISAVAKQGINSALIVSSISLILLYAPLIKIDARFLLSHILIPLGVLSLYVVPLIFLLPEGVNKTFAIQSAKIFIPVTIVSFIACFVVIGLRKITVQFIGATKEKFITSDLVLPLLPLTPVVQYLINNAEILSWFDFIVVLSIFLTFASLLIFAVPFLFRNTGSFRPLMFLGLAFSFLITNMASLTWHHKWYMEGSLGIQLLVLGGMWLISWILFKTNLRDLLYFVIVVTFLSNFIVQLTDQGAHDLLPGNGTDNMLVSMVGNREPGNTPSIYLLVYDSYVVNETMLGYGIDNQDQEQYLEGLDFTIYPHIYSVSSYSIGSMSRVFNNSVSYYGNIRKGVSGDGIVHNLLKDYGYKTYGVFTKDYFFRGILPSYDYWYPGTNSEAILLTKAIFLGELRFDNNIDEIPQKEYVHEKEIVLTAVTEDPRFVYTHSSLPGHSQNSGKCRPNEIEIYKESLARANDEMRQDIHLLLNNDPEAILIIAGDHGPALTKNCTDTRDEYDISEITRLDIQDRNGTFLAIRWPSPGFEEYADFTVLQDLFPVIFAYIFEDQGLLDSRIEPNTLNGERMSGVEVSDGTIVGGINDGESLFIFEEGD
jgi:hypothetical protein